MIRAARCPPEALDRSSRKFPRSIRSHSIRAAASNSGKIQVYGILIPLFSATVTKEPPPTAIPANSRPKEK
jgi:hypothetical protein